MSGVDTLLVASRLRWVADDLRPAAERAGLVCRHDWGLDVPRIVQHVPAWWVPTGHATRLIQAGLQLPLVSPGPRFLDTVPVELLGREVVTCRFVELSSAGLSGPGFGKVAEMKLEGVPARWWDDLANFQAAADGVNLHPDAVIQWTPTRLDLAVEYRCYVVDGIVTAISPYLVDDVTWEPGMESWTGVDVASAQSFAGEVVAAVATCPRSWVLDIARSRDGAWVALEANPSWSAGIYGCDPDAVVAALVAAVDYTDVDRGWRWQPDPHLDRWASLRPLRPR